MNQKTFYILVGVGLLLVAGLLGYKLTRKDSNNQQDQIAKIEAELRRTIEGGIENWPAYEKVTAADEKKFGNDPACPASVKGNPEFLDYLTKAQQGDAYKLDLTNGVAVFYTPNYLAWDNAKLTSWGVSDMRICTGGWPIPLYAYSDKIVWGNVTCSPQIGQPGSEACSKISRIVIEFFSKK